MSTVRFLGAFSAGFAAASFALFVAKHSACTALQSESVGLWAGIRAVIGC